MVEVNFNAYRISDSSIMPVVGGSRTRFRVHEDFAALLSGRSESLCTLTTLFFLFSRMN